MSDSLKKLQCEKMILREALVTLRHKFNQLGGNLMFMTTIDGALTKVEALEKSPMWIHLLSAEELERFCPKEL